MRPKEDNVIAGRPLRSNDIRQRNERLVLNLIYEHTGIAQSQIVSITGLKAPTVFRIFSELESSGLIEECEADREQSDKKGRRPSYYCVRPDAFYAIGVDFWSYSASILIVDFAGGVVHEDFAELTAGIDAPTVVDKLKVLIRRAIDRSGIDEGKILGIGVGAPGIVDIVEGRVLRYPRILSMSDFPIGQRLSDAFQMPVYVHNNSTVVALSECRYRGLGEYRSLFAFLIRSGVGGAFIQNGTAFVNHHTTALEVGHLSVDPNGPRCECGGTGCLETYLNEETLFAALTAETRSSTWEEIEQRVAANDEAVVTVLRRFASLLVQAATNVANLLNPDAFLVVTRYERLAEFFAAELDRAFRSPGHLLPMSDVTVVGRRYDPTLACKGAAELVFSHFFQVAA